MKGLRDTTIPARSKEIEEICGNIVPYEVAWDTFADDAGALNFVDNVACHRLNMALRAICLDYMSKQAVRDGLNSVRLANVKTPAEKKLSFDAGTLTMAGAYAAGLDGAWSDGEIRTLLIDKLRRGSRASRRPACDTRQPFRGPTHLATARLKGFQLDA